MLHRHPGAFALRDLLKGGSKKAEPATKPVLDATEADEQYDKDKYTNLMDAAGDYASSDIALKAAAAVQEWAETSDLDEGEGLGDRLFSLFAGIADSDMDGEVSEAEAEIILLAAESAWDYLESKGVPADDISELLNDYDNEVAARVQEFIAEKLPDGDEAAADEVDSFVFGDGSDEAALDAVYKKKLVIRKGKRVRINKRVSGKVRLSAKQKMAVRKMLRKSHSATAQLRRAKSMRISRRMAN
jgi:hypothetical protein